MHDDFSALDVLSCGGFRWSSRPLPPTRQRVKKALFSLRRRTSKPAVKRRFTALLPMLAAKMRRPEGRRGLQGWPVALSWPTRDVPNGWGDHGTLS
jgi:hypothetical protein